MSAERFFVIGSNSFSGASFIAAALRSGSEVVGISRSPEAAEVFLPYKWAQHKGFQFRRLNLNTDLDQIEAAVLDFQPDYVVVFAAQGMVAQSWAFPDHWYRTNLLAMVELHERLRKMPFLKKVVHASTPEVYGSTTGRITEDAPFHPSTPYAVSKAACDMHLLALYRTYSYPVAFTRSANVCGPGQQLYRIIPKTILCILTGQTLKLEGGGRSIRSFIHVDDVVEGTLRAARQGEPGDIYHLATHRHQSIRELVEHICRSLAVSFDEHVEVAAARLGQDAAYLLDTTLAHARLGWSPQRTVEDAVAGTVHWMRTNLEQLRDVPSEYMHQE